MTQDEEREYKIALEQYRNVIGYLQYENTMYWTRSGFMLAAQVVLLSFLARSLPTFDGKTTYVVCITAAALGAMGLRLCWLWTRANRGALWWIDRWHKTLLSIEPRAYGAIEVFRTAVDNTQPHTDRIPLKIITEKVVSLFRVAWLIVLVFSVVAGAVHYKLSTKVDAVAVAEKAIAEVPRLSGDNQATWKIKTVNYDSSREAYDIVVAKVASTEVWTLAYNTAGDLISSKSSP